MDPTSGYPSTNGMVKWSWNMDVFMVKYTRKVHHCPGETSETMYIYIYIYILLHIDMFSFYIHVSSARASFFWKPARQINQFISRLSAGIRAAWIDIRSQKWGLPQFCGYWNRTMLIPADKTFRLCRKSPSLSLVNSSTTGPCSNCESLPGAAWDPAPSPGPVTTHQGQQTWKLLTQDEYINGWHF